MTYPWMRRLLIFVPIAVGAGVFYLVMSGREGPKQIEVPERATFVRTITLEKTAITPRVRGFGTVQAARVWTATARVNGDVEYVHPNFKNGAILERDTEIVRVSPRDYELKIQQAEANIKIVDARIEELEAKRLNLNQSLLIEQRALALAEKQLNRKQDLKSRGTIAQASLEQEENRVLAQKQKLQDIRSNLNLIPSQISGQESQKAAFESDLETARLSLERTHIKLPFAARVVTADVEVAQFVQAGKVLGSASNIETAEVEVRVPQDQFRTFMSALVDGKVRFQPGSGTLKRVAKQTGLKASVKLPTERRAAKWPGTVVRVSDAIDPKTRTVGVIVSVSKPYENALRQARPPLVKGVFVEVELTGNPKPARLVVPRSALQGDTLFFADKDDRLEPRKVKIAFFQGDIAVLASGAKAGERVVVSDILYATKGMKLKIEDDPELARKVKRAAGPAESKK